MNPDEDFVVEGQTLNGEYTPDGMDPPFAVYSASKDDWVAKDFPTRWAAERWIANKRKNKMPDENQNIGSIDARVKALGRLVELMNEQQNLLKTSSMKRDALVACSVKSLEVSFSFDRTAPIVDITLTAKEGDALDKITALVLDIVTRRVSDNLERIEAIANQITGTPSP